MFCSSLSSRSKHRTSGHAVYELVAFAIQGAGRSAIWHPLRLRKGVISFVLLLCAATLLLAPDAHPQENNGGLSAVIESLKAGSYSEALDLCGKLLASRPNDPRLWTLRAVALQHTNSGDAALDSYRHALKISPDYLPALEGAAEMEYKRDPQSAIPLLRRVLVLQPQNATAHAMLGVIEYRNRNYSECAEDFRASGDLVRSQPNALIANALCLAHLERAAEAVPLLQQAVTTHPEDSAARFNLALLQWRTSDSAEALNTLEPSLSGQPVSSAALRLAAAIHESRGETPTAIEQLHQAIMAKPDEAANYIDFATLSFSHGSYKVGVDMVNVGLQRLPDSAALYMARGVLYGQNGEYDKAMADFEHAHTLDPGNAMTASAEGIAASQQHNHQQALGAFQRQVQEHPKDAFGYYLLAEALAWAGPEGARSDDQKQVDEAIAVARKARKLDPSLLQASDLLASLYLQNGQPEAAIKESRETLNVQPNDQQAIYTLMLALRNAGRKDEAREMVVKLTNARKAEQAKNIQTAHYGQLVEQPE